jgi:hypothetical protein
MSARQYGIAEQYGISDALWEEIKPLIPPLPPKKKRGDRGWMTDKC